MGPPGLDPMAAWFRAEPQQVLHRAAGHAQSLRQPDPAQLRPRLEPWRDATGTERWTGANQLLLSPCIDHLLDEDRVVFPVGQELVLAPHVRDKLHDAWVGVDASARLDDFAGERLPRFSPTQRW